MQKYSESSWCREQQQLHADKCDLHMTKPKALCHQSWGIGARCYIHMYASHQSDKWDCAWSVKHAQIPCCLTADYRQGRNMISGSTRRSKDFRCLLISVNLGKGAPVKLAIGDGVCSLMLHQTAVLADSTGTWASVTPAGLTQSVLCCLSIVKSRQAHCTHCYLLPSLLHVGI